MAITAFLDLHTKPEIPTEKLHAAMAAILTDTRAFDGCLGVEVLIDTDDPSHIVAVERWESEERDAAYRAWRAGDGQTNLGDFLTAPPVLTKFETADGV